MHFSYRNHDAAAYYQSFRVRAADSIQPAWYQLFTQPRDAAEQLQYTDKDAGACLLHPVKPAKSNGTKTARRRLLPLFQST